MVFYRWLVIKESFIAVLDSKKEIILDVMLLDRNLDAYTQLKNEGNQKETVRNGLIITNGVRDLTFKCDSIEEAIQWNNEIENVALTSGSLWIDEHRFGSSYPPRQSIYAQWLVDGRSYFEHVANVLELAKEEIFIGAWCLNAHIHMKRPIVGDRWRLDMILKRKADEGVKIFALLWKEAGGLSQLFESDETEKYLNGLSPNIKVSGLNLIPN